MCLLYSPLECSLRRICTSTSGDCRLYVYAGRTKVAEAKDAAAISHNDDLDVMGGPVVADVPEVAALVEAVKVHAQCLPAIASAFQFTM